MKGSSVARDSPKNTRKFILELTGEVCSKNQEIYKSLILLVVHFYLDRGNIGCPLFPIRLDGTCNPMWHAVEFECHASKASFFTSFKRFTTGRLSYIPGIDKLRESPRQSRGFTSD